MFSFYRRGGKVTWQECAIGGHLGNLLCMINLLRACHYCTVLDSNGMACPVQCPCWVVPFGADRVWTGDVVEDGGPNQWNPPCITLFADQLGLLLVLRPALACPSPYRVHWVVCAHLIVESFVRVINAPSGSLRTPFKLSSFPFFPLHLIAYLNRGRSSLSPPVATRAFRAGVDPLCVGLYRPKRGHQLNLNPWAV